ncbi:MAG: hypothetical protein REI45_13075, partial [Propionicimonas sp.]|nr:hypothetical protein [Propionicimonas sp.]
MAEIGEDPEVTFGGCLAGLVVVGRDDGQVGVAAQFAGLLAGQCRAKSREADVLAVGCDGDCDGIHGAFDQDRAAAAEQGRGVAVELGTLVEQQALGG